MKAIEILIYFFYQSNYFKKTVSSSTTTTTTVPSTLTVPVESEISLIFDNDPRARLNSINNTLINHFYTHSDSETQFTSRLFRFVFKDADLKGKNCYGRVFNKNKAAKESINATIIESIRMIDLT